MEASLRILLVEDDERLGALTARYLESHGARVTRVADGPSALATVDRQPFDAAVLDLMLPGKDGIEVCRELRRRHSLPVVMVTARGDEADRVIGLEAGADDYMIKPFSARELLARLRAQVRRARGETGPGPGDRLLRVGPLCLAVARLEATLHEQRLELTSHEFNLLRVLAEHAGRVLSREQLLELARGSAEEAFDRAIDVQISRLRAKLGDPRLIKTVRGHGYMLAP